jgi:hypothetical protein
VKGCFVFGMGGGPKIEDVFDRSAGGGKLGRVSNPLCAWLLGEPVGAETASISVVASRSTESDGSMLCLGVIEGLELMRISACLRATEHCVADALWLVRLWT